MKNKWTILGFLCVTFVIYTIDRALLGPLAIPIQKDTGVSDIELGLLNAAVFWSYAVAVPFAGWVGDRFNRFLLIGVSIVTWSAMVFLVGFAQGFWSLFLLVGIAVTVPQTLYSPCAFATVAKYHTDTRSIAMSCLQGGFYTGWLLSGVAVAGVLAMWGSWRAAYFAFGALGVCFGFAFLAYVRKSGIGDGKSECGGERPRPTFAASARAFFCCPSALLAAAGHVSFTFVAFGYTAWAPKFVALKFGLTPAAAGTGVMLYHFVAAFGAILVAGYVTDRLVGRFPRFRLGLQILSLLAAVPMLALLGRSSSLAWVWTAASLFGVAKGLFEANSVNSLYDVIPGEFRASAIGFLNVLCGVLGSLAPVVMGALSQAEGVAGLSRGFALFGGVLALAAVLMGLSYFFTFRRDRLRVDVYKPDSQEGCK